jgi:ParB family transcriptional regulator, chromosome partitioning protein
MTETSKRRPLGRGLSALLSEDVEDYNALDNTQRVRMIPVLALQAGQYQPRQRFDAEELEALAVSIRQKGILQPLIAREIEPAQYEIIAGERRWRAAQLAGLTEVPVLVKTISNREALEIALIENIQRKDLTAIEEAQSYRRLMDEFGYTQDDMGQAVGKSRSHIANSLRLLTLPFAVREYLENGLLSSGHARTLVTAEDPAVLARKIIDGNLTVRQAEDLARQMKDEPAASSSDGRARISEDIKELEAQLAYLTGLPARVKANGNGGEIILRFTTRHDLEVLLKRFTFGAAGQTHE